MNCRHCQAPLHHRFLDLGFAPPSNAYLTEADLNKPEPYFPLRLYVCERCWFVQTEDYARADELFGQDYAYFSSVSQSWLRHAADYAAMITARLRLNRDSHVVEIAANDGYLLKNFIAAGIPCLGIEPTDSTASEAERLGIPVLREFFDSVLASRLTETGQQADLIIGNNVYAHVPDINDFTQGLKTLLKPGGTITLEFPHLLRLIEFCQFDTVYHEHFSYLSLYTVKCVCAAAQLRIWNVEELLTHGGSLRIYACHWDDERPELPAVGAVLEAESRFGLQSPEVYRGFQSRVNRIKDDLLVYLIEQKRAGKKVVAYGAAAKGNTLLNYAGIKPDLLPFVCDAAASKQGKFLPGSHIPISTPARLFEQPLDAILVLPWNIADEIKRQNESLIDNGVRFVIAVPGLSII
ncbi:MAG: methyltransferase domain-containing protein [Gammaproteobacteria bacterium]